MYNENVTECVLLFDLFTSHIYEKQKVKSKYLIGDKNQVVLLREVDYFHVEILLIIVTSSSVSMDYVTLLIITLLLLQ